MIFKKLQVKYARYILSKMEKSERWNEVEQLERSRPMNDYDSNRDNDYFNDELRPDADPSYHIRIYSASGGRIIECRTTQHYNSSTSSSMAGSKHNGSSSSTQLYVIPEDADLVPELGKILMMHSLTT